MKVSSISIAKPGQCMTSNDTVLLEDFLNLSLSATPAGQLFVALSEDSTWPEGWTTDIQFDGERQARIFVRHKGFEVVSVSDCKAIEDVVRAVRVQSQASADGFRCAIKELDCSVDRVESIAANVLIAKAIAVIKDKYGIDAKMHDSYEKVWNRIVFSCKNDEGKENILVVHVQNERIAEVLLLPISGLEWYGLKRDGEKELIRAIWKARAVEFARRFLSEVTVLNEDIGALHSVDVNADTPADFSTDCYGLEKSCNCVNSVDVRFGYEGKICRVFFGENNMPVDAKIISA